MHYIKKNIFILFVVLHSYVYGSDVSLDTAPSLTPIVTESQRPGVLSRITEGVVSKASASLSSLSSLFMSSTSERSPTPSVQIRNLKRILGEKEQDALFPDMTSKEIEAYLLKHPKVYTAILASLRAYNDHDSTCPINILDGKSEISVNQLLTDMGFTCQELEKDLFLLTRVTKEGEKQAWFAITGTDSFGDLFTSLGIAAHMTSADLHRAAHTVITYHFYPNIFINRGVYSCLTGSVASFLKKMTASIKINLHIMMSGVYLILGYHFLSYADDQSYYTLQKLMGHGFIMSGVITYFNVLPMIMNKIRYKNHILRLLGRIRKRRQELEDDGYQDISLTGHSLGGHSAQVIGLLINSPVYSFHAPGGALSHARKLFHALGDGTLIQPTNEQYQEMVLSLAVKKDPISSMQCDHDPVPPFWVEIQNAQRMLDHHRIMRLLEHVISMQDNFPIAPKF